MATYYLKNIISISAGRSGQHSLAADANHFVWAWGDNYYGQLGNGEHGSGTKKLTPVQVHGGEMETEFLEDINTVSAGENHSIALDSNGSVWTWGNNYYGKLGNNDPYNDSDTPVRVLSGEQGLYVYLKNIIAISAGWDHCIALEKYDPVDPNCNGRVYTWGRGGPGGSEPYYSPYGGRLGNGTTDDSYTPVKVKAGEQDPCNPNSYLRNIIAVSAGEGHSMALDIYGCVWTWGDNYYGQLGNGTNDPCSLTPVRVVGPDGIGYLENIVAISAGFWHCLAIDAYGTIWTWGLGEEGNLGQGYNDFNTPQFIPFVYNVTQQTFNFRIQGAIDDAVNGDIIRALPGSFYENIDFGNKTVTLRSADPNNLRVVANTIIDGGQSYYVISSYNNPNLVLAGFTITNGRWYGINCNSSSLQITNCIIKDNYYSGIYCYYTSTAIIKNNLIFNNGNYSGIYLDYPASAAVIRNNTICHNIGYGIELYSGSAPNISNCIFWGNNAGQLSGCNATYSCIQNWTGGGEGNINTDPCFVDDANDNYHLSPNSPCIDKGDPNLITDPNETDIDGDYRVIDGDANYTKVVDMGADEFYWSPADFDRNEIVNFLDYAVLASAWLTNNPNISLDNDNDVDIYDLDYLCDDWLWQLGMSRGISGDGGMAQGAGFTEPLSTPSSPQQPQPEPQPEEQSELQSQEEELVEELDEGGPIATVSLACDVNEPNEGDEVTVYVYSDSPLWLFLVDVNVIGDANITAAMSSADCNQYGWDPEWPVDPYIDEPSGFVEFGAVQLSEEGVGPGNVGYLKFIYHSGQVSLFISFGCGLDNYGEYTAFSTDVLLIGRDPNQ
jgi:hypothetical protein